MKRIISASFFILSILPSLLLAAEAPASFTNPLRYRLFNFSIWQLLIASGIILVAFSLNTFIRQILKKRREKADAEEKGSRRSLLGFLLDAILLPCRMVVWAMALRFLRPVLLGEKLYATEVDRATEVILSLAVAVFIYKLVDLVEYFLNRYTNAAENKLDDMLIPIIRNSLRVLVTIITGLHLYKTISNSDISTLLAGLGIGGLAFALAAQDTLKNIFGCVMILADRPFTAGDRITLCGHDGIVESVGFRSTRVRRLDDNVVSIPNSVVADAVIQNVSKRRYIKREMHITITYDTPPAKIERALSILKEILNDHEGMNNEFPPKVFFNEMKTDCLNLLVIYWYFPPEYWKFLAHAERINLELMKRFKNEAIEFAFPTQTLYLASDPKRNYSLTEEKNDRIEVQTEGE